MANCPNCGQATERTQDWACQWCGYPLVSGSFRQISKTYQEVKAERLQQLAAVGVVETDMAEAAEMTADVSEEAVESEAPEVEIAAEIEQVVETEQEKEPVVEAESISEGELVEGESGGATKTSESIAEAEVVQPSGVIPITIGELSEACEVDSEAAEVRFAGSILQITAEVERIPEVESSEKPCIILTSSERPTAMNVLCIFDKQHEAAISRLSEGQLITVQGRYDGCVMNILVNDCVLID
jgi:hypothetical protein